MAAEFGLVSKTVLDDDLNSDDGAFKRLDDASRRIVEGLRESLTTPCGDKSRTARRLNWPQRLAAMADAIRGRG